MPKRSVCVLDMALYKTLYYILSHCVLSCVTDYFTVMFVIEVCQCLNNKRILLLCFSEYTNTYCKAVTGLATFSARIVIYLMLIRRAGT